MEKFQHPAPHSQRRLGSGHGHGHDRQNIGKGIKNDATDDQSQRPLALDLRVETRAQPRIRLLSGIFPDLFENQTTDRKQNNEDRAALPGDCPEQIQSYHRHHASDEKNRHQVPRGQQFHRAISLEVPRPGAPQQTRGQDVRTKEQIKRRGKNRAEKHQRGQGGVVLGEQTPDAGKNGARLLGPHHVEGHNGKYIGQNEQDDARQRDGKGVLTRRFDVRRGKQSTATGTAKFFPARQFPAPVRRVAGVTIFPLVGKGNGNGWGAVGGHGRVRNRIPKQATRHKAGPVSSR